MVRTTRSSARRAVSTPASSATPTTNPSPINSAQTSTKGDTDTPATSDQEDELSLKPAPRASKRVTSLKRQREAANEGGSDDEASERSTTPATTATRASKRRAVANKVYVEVPSRSSSVKAEKKPTPAPRGGSKGKGKAKAAPPPSEDEESLSEPEEIVESSDSGSEFAMSDDESDAVMNSEDEEAAEEIMLEESIRQSLQTANGRNGESSSSASRRAPSSLAALTAAAAERRIAKRGKTMTVDAADLDLDMEPSELDSEEDDFSASESESDAPLAKNKGKGKGKAKAKEKTVSASWGATEESVKKIMTFANMRRARREEQALKRKVKRAQRLREQALMNELGRPLVHSEKTSLALQVHHPELVDIWGDLDKPIPAPVPTKAEQPANLKATLLPFQRESLHWMREQEKTTWKGGILADEMGPTVAIMQWRNEIAAHTEGVKVLVWHGASRESDAAQLKKFDVVLTTYAVLESCFRKQHSGFKRKGMIVKEQSPVHAVHWKRVVLDEAHNIKERSTNTAKAAFELKSDFRWCLSGTPLQNRVGELYSIIRFLGGDPYAYYFCKLCDCKSLHWKFSDKRSCDDCGHTPMNHTCFWNNEILSPIQKSGMRGAGALAFKKLRVLLDKMMLRRTKLQRADDLGLPPRTVIVRRDYFSPEEKELYLSLFSDAKRQFATYLDQGTVLNNYSNIFSLLTRMRQMACHPDLVIRSKANASTFVPDEAGEGMVCRLCNEFAEDAIQSKCHHVFDRECIKQYLEAALETQPDCPVCHLPLTIDLEGPALEVEESVVTARQGILGRLNLDKWRSSSKIEALVEELSNLRQKDATTKSIVFSQFVNFLDLIAYRLQRAGFVVCRLEGTMSPQARDATIKHFSKLHSGFWSAIAKTSNQVNNVEVTVFLVSLKAGGVALNLTEASRVYLMDSWWNPAVEFQAMDRIHRLGQRRPVEAIKLVVEDSIESRIVQLQEKKSAMIDATLSTDDSL
ncbi:DNA repair protein rad16 [Coprinopsis cinerea okayama7|uniref:DNA repair protein rad16 n=1 Tax=Coprinopsis cinerea (strain Okayama-7 / 130 / ATCC MYA-4618 / FGSC 9003) TaxID=240176 RepID=A8PGP4_COPC7|nr:DNA repair protein rad16 [Coprinopsis cinerea okayama7\|eukprot:XP_001841249.2 DNA repair protein rad16 [Coprinopsis cinerea okayama7\